MVINGVKFDWGKRTYIMGILNRTPDSFSDGGKYTGMEEALSHAAEMISRGADIIDIGGESTRPGFAPVGVNEEIDRVVPLIEAVSQKYGIPISVDTYHAKTAEAALKAGARIINDIWGLKADPEMAGVAARYQAPVCIMHNKKLPEYENLLKDVLKELEQSVELAVKSGIKNENIIIDPGIGFGKTYEHNIEIMKNLEIFKSLGFPILLGISRKSMIGLTLDMPVDKRLEGTIAANVIGIMKGADIIRVHDVEQNRLAAVMTDRIVR
ncbi:MAG: dihydropteroate synthase [Spirochaetaceae bacterium]|jgi:dihydropteroate synthase|nr:dihydropteroate synthase [Spirochaetaceae bacterium]